MLPTKDGEKPICKCKKCGKEYIAIGVYGIGNLKRHLNVCWIRMSTNKTPLQWNPQSLLIQSLNLDVF